MYVDVVHVQQQRPKLLVSAAMKIVHEDRQVNAQTHGINGLRLLRQWSCSGPATCHCTFVKQLANELTVLLFVTFLSMHRHDTELSTEPTC